MVGRTPRALDTCARWSGHCRQPQADNVPNIVSRGLTELPDHRRPESHEPLETGVDALVIAIQDAVKTIPGARGGTSGLAVKRWRSVDAARAFHRRALAHCIVQLGAEGGEPRHDARKARIARLPKAMETSTGISTAALAYRTVTGAVRPYGMFLWTLSTIHCASSTRAMRGRAARPARSGKSSRSVLCSTTPYWLNKARQASLEKQSGRPSTYTATVASSAPPALSCVWQATSPVTQMTSSVG